jgi:hypothetical protein
MHYKLFEWWGVLIKGDIKNYTPAKEIVSPKEKHAKRGNARCTVLARIWNLVFLLFSRLDLNSISRDGMLLRVQKKNPRKPYYTSKIAVI